MGANRLGIKCRAGPAEEEEWFCNLKETWCSLHSLLAARRQNVPSAFLCWGWHCSPNLGWHGHPKALLWEMGKKIAKLFFLSIMGGKDRKIRALVSLLLLADPSRTLKRNLLALPMKLSKKKCGLLLKPSHNLCQPPLHHGRGPKPFNLVIYPRFLHPLWFQLSKSSLSPVYISTGLLWDNHPQESRQERVSSANQIRLTRFVAPVLPQLPQQGCLISGGNLVQWGLGSKGRTMHVLQKCNLVTTLFYLQVWASSLKEHGQVLFCNDRNHPVLVELWELMFRRQTELPGRVLGGA